MRRTQTGFSRVCQTWLVVFGLLAALSVSAQEALRNSLAGGAAAESRAKQTESQSSQPYTFKDGDFRMQVLPGMEFDWNDNVNLSKTNVLDDFIVKPSVGIVASYPFSQRNLLYLDVNVGYDRYLYHPDLSTFELNSSSGTGLSFDIGIKDVTVNLHDWMNYTQDAAQNAAVANTANYGTFQNTAGISATWEMNQVTLSLGYDHQNVLSTSGQFNYLDHASDMFNVRAGLRVHPQVTVGLETTAALTTYSQTVLNNNDAYTVGAYTEFRPGSALKITARGGYATYQFQQTSTNIQTSSQNSWYAGLNITHQPRESLTYSLDAGHEVQLGVQSDLIEDWYVRPTLTWKIIKDLNFITALFYEHGKQGVGNVTGNLDDTYDWYGGQLNLQQTLTRQLSLGLIYRLTLRSSSTPDDGYTQNLIGLQLTYHPK